MVRSRSAPAISSGVRATGSGPTEVAGTGMGGAPVVVAIGAVVVVDSERDGAGGDKDMTEPRPLDTILLCG